MVWIAIRNRSIHLSCFDELLPPMVQIWFQFSKGPYCRGQESVWGQERHTHEDCIKLKTILNALYFQQHPFKFQNVPIIPNHFAGEIFTTVWMSFMLWREKKGSREQEESQEETRKKVQKIQVSSMILLRFVFTTTPLLSYIPPPATATCSQLAGGWRYSPRWCFWSP